MIKVKSDAGVRIFELFTSVEGEGILYGTKTLFVRLAGCPFSCFYCDTTEALPTDSGTEYTIDEAATLIHKAIKPNTFKVNFTGGDPLMQHKAVALLAEHVRSLGVATYLESSCFDSERFDHILPYIDYAKVEFKTRDSGFVPDASYDRLRESAMVCLEHAAASDSVAFIKLVVSERTDPSHIGSLVREIFERVPAGEIAGFVIQPTSGVAEPTLERLLRMYDVVYPLYDDVRIVPQMHKQIGAP